MSISIVGSDSANAVTHGGIFHADDVMGTAILAMRGDVKLARVFRVAEDLKSDVVVYDIGGGRFDHHMHGGAGARPNGIPYAAAGLLWKEFGLAICTQQCQSEGIADLSTAVWATIDENVMAPIDAVDNGGEKRVDSLSAIISGFNPTWNSGETADNAFLRAEELASVVLENAIRSAVAEAKAKAVVENAIQETTGTVMVLDRFVPWQTTLLSNSMPQAQEILYVVYPALRGGYNAQAVPDCLGGRGQRKPFPKEWRGLPVTDLREVTGVATASFCHAAGFLVAAATKDGAISMARKAAEA